MIKIKRAYDPVSKDDGTRILVDRIWPRGVTKEKLMIRVWMKEIAPSNELRKWFNHEALKWNEFKKKYKEELINKKDLLKELKSYDRGNLTLIYSARYPRHNNAAVLKEVLEKI